MAELAHTQEPGLKQSGIEPGADLLELSRLEAVLGYDLQRGRPAIPSDRNLNINDLFPTTKGREVIASGRYPMYTAEEAGVYSDHPLWYTYGYGEFPNMTTGSRGACMVPEEGAVALVHQSTADAKRYQSYMSEMLGYKARLVTYAGDYRERFAALARRRVAVVPAPHIPEVLGENIEYTVNPRIISRVNSKDNLGEFVPKEALPNRVTGVALEEFAVAEAMAVQSLDFPVVIKGGGGNTGGEAVRIIEREDELSAALEALKELNCGTITVEEYFEHSDSLGLQFIASDEDVRFLGFSRQVLEDDGRSHEGNLFEIDQARDPDMVQEVVWRNCLQTAGNMQAIGYRGPVGLDALYNACTNEVRIVDPNARITAASPTLALLPRMRELMAVRATEMEFTAIEFRTSIDEAVRSMSGLLERGEIFMLGAAADSRHSKIQMTMAGDAERRTQIKRELQKVS